MGFKVGDKVWTITDIGNLPLNRAMNQDFCGLVGHVTAVTDDGYYVLFEGKQPNHGGGEVSDGSWRMSDYMLLPDLQLNTLDDVEVFLNGKA